MVLLVCGYWYATRDGKSRLRLKRTSGWEVYFLVALINESTSHGSLILLPLLQGRDGPGILGFTVERNYCHLYKKMEIDKNGMQSNKILKLRLVIMSHQVESVEYVSLREY
ncbi:hypothetical protein JEQ07_24250 [Serratia proteamaculans]|uniref:Uncharacterized protein n=1 Tax=Serratia proteamaculans TaxID=28151 RepID=A0ABS0TYP9_SERPR|nr:hypothetical protein [Serratia proteamaculans]MBI6183495.1 hypothetical protein [Serratia proteamaculans]